ncbi:MAG: squalene synthase HpnC [Vicinamibacterales bacterium]
MTKPDDACRAAYCAAERIARAHYENFPVASRLLPRAMRPHVAAVYAFARAADDFADEDDLPADERLRRLDGWHRLLLQSIDGTKAPGELPPLFAALGHTVRVRRLPIALFEDLLSAFRQDVTKSRYADFSEVLDYSRRSANPIGRLVLRIAGYEDARFDASSDCLCTALQLTNFWQDLAVDWRRGRLYVPLDDCREAGAEEADLDRGRITPAWRRVLGVMADRTRELFDKGRPIADMIRGRLGLELRLTWLGGARILERLERAGFDVFRSRPSLGTGDFLPLAVSLASWRFRRRRS